MNTEHINRKEAVKYRKAINNMPKYDIGKQSVDVGYQAPTNNVTPGYISQNATDYSSAVEAQKKYNLSSALTNTASTASTVYNAFNTAKSAASGASAAAGTAASVAGIALGTLNLGMGVADMFTNHLTESDIQGASGKSTQYIDGVAYDQYAGYDREQMEKYTRAQNTGSTINNVLSGVSAGAGTGSLFSPIGTVIGGAAGGVVGLVTSLFGGSGRQNAVNRAIERTNIGQARYNAQSESEAYSQAMRNRFNMSHADKGKSEGGDMEGQGNIPDYTGVWTPQGVQYGPVNSLVGKGETMADLQSGDATLITQGTKGVDNQPSVAQDGDNITIFGNKKDPVTGKSFADLVAPLTVELERLNNIKSTGNKQTQAVQQREIDKAKQPILEEMRKIANRQKILDTRQAYKYNKGKLPGFKSGLNTPTMFSILPAAANFIGGLEQYKDYAKETPTATQSYVANPYAQTALSQLSRSYNVNPELQMINDTSREQLYHNNQALSAGQRMIANQQMFNNMARTRVAAMQNANEQNRRYAKEYADMAYQIGNSEAQRRQASNAAYNDQYAKAVATRRKGMETARATVLSNINSMFANLNNNHWTNQMMGLYQQELNTKQKQIAALLNKDKE